MVGAAAEKEFSLWLMTQTNARGLPYEAHVANRYAACLRTEPLKLDIPLSTEERDTYRCRTLQDLDRLIKLFRAAPNFQEAEILSAIIGHISSATTLNIYTRITDEMQKNTARKISEICLWYFCSQKNHPGFYRGDSLFGETAATNGEHFA